MDPRGLLGCFGDLRGKGLPGCHSFIRIKIGPTLLAIVGFLSINPSGRVIWGTSPFESKWYHGIIGSYYGRHHYKKHIFFRALHEYQLRQNLV